MINSLAIEVIEMAGENSVSFAGVMRARRVINKYLARTPLRHYPILSQALGCRAFIKHENHQPTGSFKIRGGINLISSLSAAERERGVISATRGNHGQSLACAASIFGARAVIVVPEGNNPEKNLAMSSFGAELIVHGRDFDQAREKAEELAAEHGYRYVHPANEPLLVNGVATYALEIFEEMEPDVILVPVGLGTGVSGVLTVAEALGSRAEVIAVQAERAPCVYLSWRSGRLVRTESSDTFADGLATRVPAELTLSLMRGRLSDFILVSEEEIRQAILLLWRATHNIAEGAGAAATAGAVKIKQRLKDKTVVMIMTGSNIDTATLARVLTDPAPWS